MSSAALQNLIYALIQVAHNFGAAAVIGFASYGLMRRVGQELTQRTAFLGSTTHGRNMAGARSLWRATGMQDWLFY